MLRWASTFVPSSTKLCLHMVFMAHMKLCTDIPTHCVLGLGYSHMVTKVISRSAKALALPVEERSSTHRLLRLVLGVQDSGAA